MGNCQAVDAAALVILHPNGKQERMYWPVTAQEIMKINPGHYVSLIIPIPVSGEEKGAAGEEKMVRFTRVKLLRPTDTLVLGRAYRLVTTQEVMKVIKAKKQAKMKRNQQLGSDQNLQMRSEKYRDGSESVDRKSEAQKKNTQVTRTERSQQRLGSGSTNLSKHKNWRPSLQSISEYSA